VPADFLETILKHKHSLLQHKKAFLSSLKSKMNKTSHARYHVFKKAVSKPGGINLIAELKKASPSQGLLRKDFDILKLAQVYVQNGADALSVLTEDKFFLGDPAYIRRLGEHASVPLLMKDFIIEEDQIYEAVYYGAHAILLIVSILKEDLLRHLLSVAHTLGLDCLVEIHDEGELEKALGAGAEIIGINNRNLHTFAVDSKVSEELIPRIPKDKVIVAESGIKTHEEVKALEALGAHAVLIGETFMRSADVAQKMREVMGERR
jgi:indole-3-glycerol phosphate synthase